MKNLILHIPHSSTFIPFKDGFSPDKSLIQAEILKLTDWYTDDLFSSHQDSRIVAPFSRVFCDPERFSVDQQEEMAQYGMGVLYEKTDRGDHLRAVSPELRERILDQFYWPHHQRLNEAVKQQLDIDGEALIVDCHSFSDTPFNRDLNQKPDRPDFNIGTDPFHTPQRLIDISNEYLQRKGFTVGIDRPYQGSIVPLEYYHKNGNVQTIMIEINRKLYLKENTNVPSERYEAIKAVINEYLETIKTHLKMQKLT